MARDYFDESKNKKKKKETTQVQKVAKSPSVSQTNNNVNKKASKSTFMGGGSAVRNTEKTVSRSTTNRTQSFSSNNQPVKRQPVGSRTNSSRLTAAQRQKMGLNDQATAEDRRSWREKSQARQEQARIKKMGLAPEDQPTAAQKKATDRALRNTPSIIKESAKGAAYGHLTTLNDIASIKSQGNGKSREEVYDPALAERSRQQAEQRVKKLQGKTQETEDAIQKLTKNAKGLEKAYYGAVESGTGMLTDIGIGALTGTGQVGSLAAMASRTYGATRGKAQKEGATEAEDRAYAAAQAAKEVGTELMFPGAGLARGYAGKTGLSLADTAANILTKNLRGKAADIGGAGVRLLGGVLEENAEEVAGWGLDPLIKEITYGKNARTRNAQQAMKERSNALRAEIQNEDDARAAAAYLSSDDFFEQTVNAYREAGLNKKDAEEVADRMRDYLTASLTGDTDSMEQIEDEVSKKVAGSKKLEWDFDELKDTIASTTLLTAATGLPGTGMTAVKGAALRDQLGNDGVRALANTAIDFEDGELSLKAQAMKDRLDSGKELTGTQVYDLQVGMQEQIRKDTQREESSRRMADKRIKSDNLLTPYRQNENGGIDLDEATEASYREHVSRAKDIIDGLTSETKESLTANEKVDGSKAIAGFQTGVFTIEDANTLNYSNTTVRAAFEEATGVDLGQYVVKNKDGSVNIPATNTKTKDALFAMAADNLVKSAQAETANWMDNTKGQVVTQVSARMGAQGSAVLQQALDDVDERDRSKYMMTANATDMLYQAARNMGTEWESIAPEATKMFPGISESKLKMMYEAGLADREMANDKARGRQVRMGEALTEMGEQVTATGKVFIDTEVPVKGSVIRTFTEIAKNLGADIHFVDYIYDSENNPIAGANGSYDPNTNTFHLNVATGVETNIGYIFMHETTHYLKTYAPEQYQALENLVREKWFAFNPSQMQDAIARKIEAYKRVTKGQQVLSEEQALEEIIADASHDFINDPEFAKQVAEEDMGLAKAVLDSIRNALRMLRRIFASGSIDDDTHMNSLFRELDIMAEAEKLWLDAYKTAVRNSAINAVNEWQDKANQKSVAEPIEEKQSFSISEPVERVKDLIAVHNLKPDDIRNTFELGGFPMPSIAVTKDSMGHDMYGDISLLFGSDTIDPKFFRSNQVFGGDAYTPTFPATQYKPNEDIVEKFRDIYYDNAKTLGYDAMRPFYELAEDAENALNRNGGEQGLIDRYKNDIRAMRTFLKINGKDVEDVVKRTEDTISETEQKLCQHFIDTLGEDAIREFEGESIPHGKAMMDHRKNWTYDHSDEIKSAYKDFLNREFSFSDEEISNVLDNMSLFETMKLVRNALNYLNNGPTTVKEEVDRAATDKAIEDAAHELGYEEWIDGLLTGIEEKRGIRNDKEFFTRNGNRRSWDTLHDDITLENVVKAMRSELAAGGNGFLWKNPKGAAQKQYKSLDEIRADEDRLQQLPEEEYKALEQAATQKLSDVLSDVVDNNPGRFMNSFGAVLDTGEYIAEILNETRDKATMQRKLKKDYSLDVSDEQMDRIAEAIDEIANIPTGYFEAKPRRAVGFDEVKAAIIPQTMDEDIKAGLESRGIPFYEYDPEVDGDRTEVVNRAATEKNLRFSISESTHVMYTPKGVEVVQNPTDNEYRDMREEILSAYPWLRGTGEPLLRKTYDESGNEYYWNAFEAMHSQVEPYINKEYNTRTSQQWKWYEKPDKDDYPIDYSKQGYRFSITDAEGNTLSEGQAEFFADSKMVDAEGRLKPMYHGTQNEFYEFDITKAYPGTLGRGFYFSDSDSHAGVYGKTNKYYLNLVNPLMPGTNTITKDQLHRFVSELAEDEDYGLENYGYGATVDSVVDSIWGKTDFAMLRDLNLTAVGDFAEAIKVFNRVNDTDYDGIITDTETLAFYPQQVKSVDNLNPTLSKDTRYSITDSNGKELTDGQVEYFKNSQARNSEGKMQVVYHTTNYGGFTIFDPSYSDDKRSLFFASNWNVSQTYGRNADRKYRFEDYSFKSLNDFAKAYAENFSYNLNDPENGILEQVVNALRIHIEKNSMPAFDLGDTMFERVKNYMKIAEAGDVRADKYRIEMEGAYGGMVRASSYDELLGKLSRQMSNNQSKSGYYSCYLNLENPLIVDAQNQSWNNIPYGEYSEDAVLAIKNLTVQDMGNGIYVNIWGDKKTDGAWQEFRDSDTIEFEYLNVDGEYEIPEKAWDEVYDFLVKHGLSSDYAYEHSDAFFDFNGLDTFDKDGRKVESDVRRYRTRELAALAATKGCDGVIIRNCYDIGAASHLKGEGISDIYIAFSSNQVKDINNENPTENPDIRYSFSDEDEAMSHAAHDYAYDNSYEALAYYETQISNVNPETFDVTKAFKEEDVVKFLDALKAEDAVPSDDAKFEEDRVRRARSKEDFFNNVYAKWNDRWTTEGEVLKISSVKRDITNLVKGAMANSDSDAQYRNEIVRKTLIDARLAYQLMKQDRTELASYLLYHSARRMMDGLEFIRDDTAFKEYKEIRDFLRGYRINAPEEYWENEKFLDFRKEYYERLRIGKGNSNIEDVYKDCQDRWPHLFNESEREKAGLGDAVEDLLLHIGVVVDSNVTPFMEAYSSEEATSLAYDLADQLYEIIANGERIVSLADSYKERFDAKTKAMKARHAEAILRERKISIRKEREKFRIAKERQKERQAHTKYFESIKDTHDQLVDRLDSNTADKHIPEQYKRELAKLLGAFDLQTIGSKNRQARTGHVAKNTIRMSAIKEALKNIENRSDIFHVNDAITDIIDGLSRVEGETLDSLSASELHEIDRMLKALLHEFNRYEKVKIGAKNMQAADLAEAQVSSALEHAKIFGPGNDYRGPKGWMDQIINMDEMTPAYMFKRIDPDNVGLGLMWKEIRRSQDRYIRNTEQINKWVDEITGKYKNNGRFGKKYGSDEIEKWRSTNYIQTFELTNGTVQLTPAQMMSLYCLSKRNQAYGHMVGAGIVVAPVSFQAKIMSDLKKKINRSLPVILTDADIKQIVTALTPEQMNVAEQLQELMSTKMADLGNEASMNVIGIKLFNESDYFPIKSDKAALERDLTNEQFENAIRNFGFTKAVQPGARNAIMIEDIFDVVTEHCNNMNLYNSYSETLNDFMKVFNKHSIQEDGADYSVRQALAHAYSNKATTFILEFIRDLNGNVSKGRTTGIETAMNDTLANAKKASVFANIRVLLLQPTAITRAFAVINPKYLKGVKIEKGAMQEMFEHCPIALWKSWGYYDINMGKSIEAIIMNEGNWLEDMATQAYGAADNVTWTAIWQMVKAEMKDTHPEVKIGTEEYWELCNERMSEIVDLTQVVDSPLHRSHAMRAKDVLHKTMTSFMAEPTLTFNMLRDGYMRAREAWIKGNKAEAGKIMGRIGSVALLQAATVAAAAAVADALRGKNKGGGGDDEEPKSLWWINFVENFKDEMKLWNKVYYVKDIASIFEGWDNANLALQGWKTLGDGFRQFDKKLFEGSKTPWWTIYYNLLGGVGYFAGVPVRTLMKDGRAIFEFFGGQLPESLVGEEKTSGVVDSDSTLQSLRLFKQADSKSTSSTSVVKIGTEDKWYDYENNPITVRDGSPLDKFLNHFGVNLTVAEKAAIAKDQKQKERDKKAEEIGNKYADLTGEERDKKVWSAVTSYFKGETEDSKAFADMVKNGDYGSINEIKQIYMDAGGGEEYFDSRVLAESKTALKKSIKYDQSDAEIEAQENIKDYLLEHGMTDYELSEMAYKSNTAKDMKIAFMINDKDAMLETLEPLVRAGLSYEDLERIWDNRNRIDVMKYKSSKGRYADRLKSTGKFIWPTNGQITSYFGYRNAPTRGASSNHPAIDIGAPMGAEVVASDGGVVISAGWNGGYGNSVGIKHDNGMVTYYNHLSAWNVKEGDTVAQGQPIANVGSTGVSTGPHLDFKVLDSNGKPVDPLKYLASRS